MLLLAGLLLRLLAFGTLVAPVFSLRFNSTSVQQCSPLLLSFTGLASPASGAPASLAIIPLNSTAIMLPLQDINLTAGIGLNFVPFAAGSRFIVSLVDANGNNIINTSDIFPVLPSPNNNSSCIPAPESPQPSIFTLATPGVSQCQNFTISYNPTVTSQAPSVRLYSPGGPSLDLNVTSDDSTSGVATYLMAYVSGRGITLTMSDGNGTIETTPLLLVEDDPSSPSACLNAMPAGVLSSNSTLSSDTSAGNSALNPRNIAIIGASVGGAAVLLGICLAIFFIRDHRRYKRQLNQFDKSVSSDTDSHNEKVTTPQVIRLDNTFPTGFVKAPVDITDLSSEKGGYYDKISLASWSQATPEDQYSPSLSEAKQLPRPPENRLSPDLSTVPQPTLLQSPTITRSLSGRHLRAPSDVPADLNSRCSTVSTASFYPSMYEGEPREYEREHPQPLPALITQSLNHRGSFKLPTSPRDGLRGNISRANSRATSRATSKRSLASTSASTKEWSERTFTR